MRRRGECGANRRASISLSARCPILPIHLKKLRVHRKGTSRNRRRIIYLHKRIGVGVYKLIQGSFPNHVPNVTIG